MKLIAIISLAALAACASARSSGWAPALDARTDPHPGTIDRDLAECRDIAHQSTDVAVQAGKGGAVGAAAGAAGGAVIGAVSGHPVKGAATGAVIGGGAGAGHQAYNADQRFKAAYSQCLRNRGHNVLQ